MTLIARIKQHPIGLVALYCVVGTIGWIVFFIWLFGGVE